MGKKSGIVILLLWGIFSGCQKADDVKSREAVLTLSSNPFDYPASQNDQIPTLGRVLFYDTRMSVNNSVSCATCHKQARAFADNVSFSAGFEGKPTARNSMPIQNLVIEFTNPGGDAMQNTGDTLSLFWDGREKLLKAMVLRPITNHVEMGIDNMDALALKLVQLPEYRDLFAKAYGSQEVTEMKIAEALSEFLINIQSKSSRFDLLNRPIGNIGFTDGIVDFPQQPLQDIPGFSVLENAGLHLFKEKYNCNSCHQIDALNGYQLGGGFVNIGLDKNYTDVGLADVTQRASDVGKFKIPTLRNVALTAPYMHDGRFRTLDDVLEHYSSGIIDHPNLDVRLKTLPGQATKMNISSQEKQAIIAFLNTLTDYSMITDPKFSNPFVSK